jgi:hypothetical protein
VSCISASNFLQHFLGVRYPGLQRHGELSPPLSPGCIPPDCQEKIPPGANRQLDLEGDLSSWQVGDRALDVQQDPVRHRNQRGEGNMAHQAGKNPGLNSGLPQEAEGETDHLPETTSNH